MQPVALMAVVVALTLLAAAAVQTGRGPLPWPGNAIVGAASTIALVLVAAVFVDLVGPKPSSPRRPSAAPAPSPTPAPAAPPVAQPTPSVPPATVAVAAGRPVAGAADVDHRTTAARTLVARVAGSQPDTESSAPQPADRPADPPPAENPPADPPPGDVPGDRPPADRPPADPPAATPNDRREYGLAQRAAHRPAKHAAHGIWF